MELVRDLRKRCAWDAAQTRETLRSYLVEEVLELDQALAAGDPGKIKDELGDLVLHLAFQIVLGEEAGQFGAEDVTKAIEAKMWRRHPHLFPELASPEATNPGREPGVAEPRAHARGQSGHTPATWEKLKRTERGADRPGVFDGLPPSLPVLIMAFRLQERAAGVGFDWPDIQGPLAKVHEELKELEHELSIGETRDAGRGTRRIEEEVGDLLFSVVNVSRKAGVDPRAALEKANGRFVERFRKVEALAEERGVDLGTAGLDALDKLWEEAKQGDEGRETRDG